MKLTLKCILIYCLFGYFFSCDISQDEKKMPITTASSEAKELFLQAREKFDNIEYVAAKDLLDEAIARDAEFAMAYLYRSLITGNLEESRKFIGKAYALLGQISEEEAEFIMYYKALFDANGSKQKEHLIKLEQLLPNDPYVLYELGIYQYAFLKDYKRALAYFQKVIEKYPDHGSAYNLIGYSHIQLGDYDAAEAALKKYIEVSPNSPNPYDSYAELLLKRGRYDQSIKNYQKAFDMDNKFSVALRGIGVNYAMKREFDKSREYFNQAYEKARLISEKFTMLSQIIVSYVEEGNIEEAIRLCDQRFDLAKELKLINNQINSMGMAAFILRESGDLEKAQEYYDYVNTLVETSQMEDIDRDNYRLMVGWNECMMLAAQNRMEEASTQAENCLKWAEKQADPGGLNNAYGQMGQLATRQGNYKTALEYLQKADPQDPYNWYQMGLAYEGQNMPENAAEWFTRVVNENDLQLGLALVRKRAQTKLNK